MLVLLKILVAALVCARWLVPTEAAAQGATLWLVQLWPVVLGVWAWYALRTPGVPLRGGTCDVMLALVVAGHVISAMTVLLTEGQKRAAVNMLWEWVGLGISFFLLRQLIVTRVDRDRLLLAFASVMVSLSGLGIWQHFVFYPQTRVRYEQARGRLDDLLSGPVSPRTAGQQYRIRRAANELVQMGVPPEALSGRMRQAFEGRLTASSEPFGPFALANTFAGFLAIGLVLLIAAGRNLRRCARGSLVQWGGLVGAIVLVAFCLLLTKSRTAWVGTVCGLCTLGIASLRRQTSSPHEVNADRQPFRRWWLITLGAGAFLGTLLIVGVISGGLDGAVLSEAPKSLTYRMEYWEGSWGVVREHPWLGVGPGNFRQHYLQYKLPGSSEEISDPHNFLLGIWTSGGLIAVCGLIGLSVAWTAALRRTLWQTACADTTVRPKRVSAGDRSSGWLWGTGLGFVLVAVFRAVVEDRFDVGLIFLPAGWLAVVVIFRRRSNCFSISSREIGAAMLTVMVHLLGAGGIEMPAVVQAILLLLAVGLSGADCSAADGKTMDDTRPSGSRRAWLPAVGTGIGAVMLFVCCLLTATRPVLDHQALVARGDAAMSEGNPLSAAERSYRAAAVADPLSPEPIDRLAELEFQKWRQGPRVSGEFHRVVKFSEEAIRLDPDNWLRYRALGNRYQEAFLRTHSSADAVSAVKYLVQALDRYPNDAMLCAELSQAFSDTGGTSQARRQAKQAIRLDHLNRNRGHRDRFLSKKTRKALQQILESAPERGQR